MVQTFPNPLERFTDWLEDKLFGPEYFKFSDGQFSFNLSDRTIRYLLSTPQIYSDAQVTKLKNRISAYETAMEEIDTKGKQLREEYDTLPLSEIIARAKALKLPDKSRVTSSPIFSSAYFWYHCEYHDAIDFKAKVEEVQKIIDKSTEMKKAGETNKENIVREVGLELVKDLFPGCFDKFCKPLKIQAMKLADKKLIERVVEMDGPTVEEVVQDILNTEPAFGEALKLKETELNSKYGKVDKTLETEQINGFVKNALQKSKRKELMSFVRDNIPYFTSDELEKVREQLCKLDNRRRDYSFQKDELAKEKEKLDDLSTHTINLVGLKYDETRYLLDKIYSRIDGSTTFKGEVVNRSFDILDMAKRNKLLDKDSMKNLMKNLMKPELTNVANQLSDAGFKVEQKDEQLVIDEGVATVELELKYKPKLVYQSVYDQLDEDSLRTELRRIQKVFRVFDERLRDTEETLK